MIPDADMDGLRISDDLTLPLDAVTQTFALLAIRGMGKTYTGAKLAEEMVKAGLPVAVIDPIGVWWGLRLAADGEGPGLPVVVFGGDYGDLPLPDGSGAAIADLLVAERIPVVLDLSLMRKGKQVAWVTEFAERLYFKNRDPLHLILDEADSWAPQRAVRGQERCLGAIQDLVRKGRARGIGVTLITQRPAVVSKDVLTQTQVLVTLRLVSPQDRKAIDAWVEAQGTREQRDDMMASLASLPIGDAYVWSPGWLRVFQRVTIGRRETFDSSATPTMGGAVARPTGLANIDVDRIRAALGEVVTEPMAENPAALRARIAELERRLADRPAAERVVERVEVAVPTIPPWVRELVVDIGRHVSAAGDAATELADAIDDVERTDEPWGAGLRAPVTNGNTPATPPAGSANDPGAAPPPIPFRLAEPIPLGTSRSRSFAVTPSPDDAADLEGDGETMAVAKASVGLEVNGVDLPPTAVRILRTLTDVGAPLRLAHVAALSGMSHRGGAFAKHVADLRRAGLIVGAGPGIVATTAEGRTAVDLARGGSARRLTGEEIRARWHGVFSANARAMLGRLAEVYPEAASRSDLAASAGMAARGGAFQGYISELRDRELVDLAGAGMLRLNAGDHYPIEDNAR